MVVPTLPTGNANIYIMNNISWLCLDASIVVEVTGPIYSPSQDGKDILLIPGRLGATILYNTVLPDGTYSNTNSHAHICMCVII